MKPFFAHIQRYTLRGLLAIIPLLLSILAISLLYVLVDKKILLFINQFIDVRYIPGLGIFLVLGILYLLGLLVSNVMGRQFFALIENISQRIPIIQLIYSTVKSFSESFENKNGKPVILQRAVWVDFNDGGHKSLGFVIKSVTDERADKELLVVYIPRSPNPLRGYVFVLPPEQVIDTPWSIDEALRMDMTAGIISPAKF